MPVFSKTRRQALIEATTVPMGLCYEWAYRRVVADASGTSVLVHGTVEEPFSSPKKSYLHAWVEEGGKVYDWQTMEAFHGGKWRGKGYPKDVFYELFKPSKMTRYSKVEATVAVLRSQGGRRRGGQHYGPWK